MFVLCVSVSPWLTSAAQAPPLPSLAIDSFPPQARTAIAEADRQARARSNDAAAVGALGMVLHAWEQWDAAHTAYGRAQHLAPKKTEWLYLDGVVLHRLGRPAEAADRFQKALVIASGEGSPEGEGSPKGLRYVPVGVYVPVRVRLAEALFDAGDLEGSARAYAGLAGEAAAAPVTALGLGRLAALAGRHDEAVAHFQRAIALFPEFGAAHYGLAMSERALGRRDEARRALEKHKEFGARWPAIDDPLLAKVTGLQDDERTHLQQALRRAEDGDIAGAIAAHEAALARNPALAQAHANLITLYGRAQNWAKAEEHYRAVIALGLNRDEAHYNYGVLLGLQERWAEAAAAYREAVAVNPWHAQAHNNLGLILERERKLDEAAEQYRLAVEGQPGFRLARFNLARMLIARGKNDEAVAELEKLVEPKDAETPRYIFALATAHVRAGRHAEGARLATEARDLALEHGQQDLAAAIERDLRSLQGKR